MIKSAEGKGFGRKESEMERILRVVDIGERGAVDAVRALLWSLMEADIVQALLVPLQRHPHEAPAPTLIKNRERLNKANPLAPVMTLNSAKIVGLLLAQESGKRLAAVMRPCEICALLELRDQDRIILDDLVTISVDCLGSHDEDDYVQRSVLWGDEFPTHESLRWSRRGPIAPYRFRQACQVCERPTFDQADISIGLFGQNTKEQMLVSIRPEIEKRTGFARIYTTRAAREEDLSRRNRILNEFLEQRHKAHQRALTEIRSKVAELTDLVFLLESCTLCGKCQEACPLTRVSEFDIEAYEENTQAYLAARILDIVRRSESCVGCGMCEAACELGIPLMLITQMIRERTSFRQDILEALSNPASVPH
jgi:formate dehydrogenase subunit beta